QSINRAGQADLFTAMQALQGTSDHGTLYLPIIARKQAAFFYVHGAEASVGILKPELAMNMIDDAKDKEKTLYGIDLEKNKNADPTLASMAQEILPLLPQNVRKTR